MSNKADSLLTSIGTMASAIAIPIDNLADTLRNMTWSTGSEINDALSTAKNQVPPIEDWDRVNGMMTTCDVLSKAFPSPAAIIDSLASDAMDELYALLSTIPEFSAARMFEAIVSLLPSTFSEYISDLRKLLDCISGICGTDVSGQVSQLNSVLDIGCMGQDGALSTDYILQKAGIVDQNKIDRFKQATDIMGNFKQSSTAGMMTSIGTSSSSLSSSISAARSKLTQYSSIII